MSSAVNVRSVEAVDNLKVTFNRFQSETQETLQATEQEIRRTEEWLQERLAYWRAEEQRRQVDALVVSAPPRQQEPL
jgi:hypothetical protein